jgi:hypothetical protein
VWRAGGRAQSLVRLLVGGEWCTAMQKSAPASTSFRSAWARLMTTGSIGRRYPELTIARATRCVLSFTAVSRRRAAFGPGLAVGGKTVPVPRGFRAFATEVLRRWRNRVRLGNGGGWLSLLCRDRQLDPQPL